MRRFVSWNSLMIKSCFSFQLDCVKRGRQRPTDNERGTWQNKLVFTKGLVYIDDQEMENAEGVADQIADSVAHLGLSGDATNSLKLENRASKQLPAPIVHVEFQFVARTGKSLLFKCNSTINFLNPNDDPAALAAQQNHAWGSEGIQQQALSLEGQDYTL